VPSPLLLLSPQHKVGTQLRFVGSLLISNEVSAEVAFTVEMRTMNTWTFYYSICRSQKRNEGEGNDRQQARSQLQFPSSVD
jgi:hypothetical protein